MRTPPPLPIRERGFTLIEVIVSLALFALISLAGIALLNTVLNVQRRTERRLEALASLQRAIYLITNDFERLDDGPLLDHRVLGFSRRAGSGTINVRYFISETGLQRETGGARRTILPEAKRLAWLFQMPDGSWRSSLPGDDDPVRPNAVQMILQLGPTGPGLSGEVRA